jgi:hypothetical protein
MFLVYFERLDPGSDFLGYLRYFCGVKGQNTGSAQQKLQNIVKITVFG